MRRFITILAILTTCATGQAQEARVGSWNVGVLAKNRYVYAGNVNESNSILAQYCLYEKGECLWMLTNGIECKELDQYSVFISADTGPREMKLICMKPDGKARFAFVDFSAIDHIIRSNTRIGLAMPMEMGTFQSSRFSLEGTTEAMTQVTLLVKKLHDRHKGAKDEPLR